MKDFKVKLISLPKNLLRLYNVYNVKFLPYGLGVLTAFLRNNDYNVTLEELSIKIENNNRKLWLSPSLRINLNILRYEKKMIDYVCGYSCDRKIERFVEQIARITDCEGYDLIGISIFNYFQFLFALLLCKKIKSISNAKVALGGTFITIYGQELFNQFPIGDYMILGDGQIPLLRLIEHLEGRSSIKDVPNLLYKQDGTIKANPREFFPIEDLYIPDFSDISLDFYQSGVDSNELILPYQISRGCIHNCNFCQRRAVNPSVEFKSYNKIITELKTMKGRYQSNSFWFYDDAINCSYGYLDRLCDIFIEERLDITWRASAAPDNLDREILRKLRKAGCRFLSFGIESGSNRIIKSMGKSFNIEQATKVLIASYEEGIKNYINFMVGFPHEKEEDMIETIEFIKKNSDYIDLMAVHSFRVGCGAPLYNNPKMFGIENLRPTFDLSRTLHFKYFAFDEIGGLKWEEKVKQQEYYRKELVKVIFKYVVSKKYRIAFIPFRFYFWLVEKPHLLNRSWFFDLFRQFLPYLRKKRA